MVGLVAIEACGSMRYFQSLAACYIPSIQIPLSFIFYQVLQIVSSVLYPINSDTVLFLPDGWLGSYRGVWLYEVLPIPSSVLYSINLEPALSYQMVVLVAIEACGSMRYCQSLAVCYIPSI